MPVADYLPHHDLPWRGSKKNFFDWRAWKTHIWWPLRSCVIKNLRQVIFPFLLQVSWCSYDYERKFDKNITSPFPSPLIILCNRCVQVIKALRGKILAKPCLEPWTPFNANLSMQGIKVSFMCAIDNDYSINLYLINLANVLIACVKTCFTI